MENLNNEAYMQRSVGAALRISFIALLFIASFWIIKPFLAPVLWGIVFAVGIYPLHKRLSKILGNKEKWSSIIISLLGVSLIVIPIIMFTNSTVDSVSKLSTSFENGTMSIPQPDQDIRDWPLVGKTVYQTWSLAANNIAGLFEKFEPQIKEAAPKLTSMIASLFGSIFLFIIAIIIAGALLLYADAGKKAADKIFTTLVGEKAHDFSTLAAATIRSVVQGVIGIAIIQTLFLSLGLYFIDMPAVGIISIVILLVAIMQLPLALVTIPIIVYVFSYADTTPAIIFAIWSIIWSMADSFLKPMFLGKGIDIPMLVVLLGSIGGMMFAGPVGLFLGSVILALTYKIFIALIQDKDEIKSDDI